MGLDPGGIESYCRARGIQMQAYSPLGAGTSNHPRTPELINGPLVSSVGAKHGKTGAQVSLRWLLERGWAVAASSTNPAHLAADLDVFGWALDGEDVARLDAADEPTAAYSFAAGYSFACNA